MSALAVLRSLTGLLQTVLLALLDPGVAGEEAGLLERGPVVGVHLDERAGDRQAQRAGLPGDPAALEVGPDVEGLRLLQDDQRLPGWPAGGPVREVLLERLAVEQELPGAGGDPHPDHGLLAAADGLGGLRGHPGCARSGGR